MASAIFRRRWRQQYQPRKRRVTTYGVVTPGTHNATGTQASLSTLTGAAFVTRVATGTQASTSTLTAAQFVTRIATGTQASLSTITGARFVTRMASGTQASLSTLTGVGTIDGQKNATGTQASLSTLSGTTVVTRVKTGTLTGTSTLTGAASILQTRTATGTQASISTLTGSATVVDPDAPVGRVLTPGWGGLISILAEARQLYAESVNARPVACPNDGEPLTAGPHGELHCRYDGFIYAG